MSRMSKEILTAYRALCERQIAEGINVPQWRAELRRVERLIAAA